MKEAGIRGSISCAGSHCEHELLLDDHGTTLATVLQRLLSMSQSLRTQMTELTEFTMRCRTAWRTLRSDESVSVNEEVNVLIVRSLLLNRLALRVNSPSLGIY